MAAGWDGKVMVRRLWLALLAMGWQCAAADAVTVTVTAYCGCRICTPGLGVTAMGTRPKAGRTVAANWLPFGTRLNISGIGTRVVEDRMARRFQRRVDVYMDRHEDAKRFGKKNLKVTVYQCK